MGDLIGNILAIVGALAFFIYGMKIMSDGIQRAAGSQLRNILQKMTKNRFLGVFTGFLSTALVQSSSATTVMTVSFANAGLLTLVESAGVMMGANIGTTITGWLISVLGFKISLHTYSIPLFAFGVPMLFSNRSKLKYWGEFIIGFSILLLGLAYLKDAVPDLKNNTEVLDFLSSFTEWGLFSRILFVIVGALITIIVQSSSAAMAITLTLCAQGWLPFEVAASMILGENIGTTITAEVASLVGNTNARRAARIHSMFNLIGVAWMVILMPYFLPLLSGVLTSLFGILNPYESSVDMPIALSAFHTAFNTLNVLLLIGFVHHLVKLSKKTISSKPEEEEESRLKFIKSTSRTPELSLIELQKETAHFGDVTSRMNLFTQSLINTTKPKEQKVLLKKLKKYEKITDNMEIEITEYITKLSNEEVTPQTSLRLRAILNICNDLERIGDIYYQVSKSMENKIDNRYYFTPDQRNNLNAMLDKLTEAFDIMNSNLNSNYENVTIDEANKIESDINALRDQFRIHNLSRLGDEDYLINSAMVYNNIFSSLEKVGDHTINISEAVIGKI